MDYRNSLIDAPREIVREREQISPTVHRIFTLLKDRIQSGIYPNGEWLPTERTLSDEFKVSRILIRSVVKELEREQLISCSANRRPIVQSIPPRTRAKESVISRSIALWIWPQQAWPGSSLIIRGIQEGLGEEFRLVLGGASGGTWSEICDREARFLRQILRDRDIEGVILSYTGGETNIPLLEELRILGVPLVFLDHRPPVGFEADYVGVNNRRSAELAVKHLIAQGHRRIAHVSNFDTLSTVEERLEGYQRALQSAGIPFRPELVRKDPGPPGDDQMAGCEGLVADLLRLPEPPTAIFTVHDVAAFRVITALHAVGLRVPEDISVVGFDGIERWSLMRPFLTTLYQPFEEIGSQAAELLLERLNGRSDSSYNHVILNAQLSLHRSIASLR